MPDKEISTEPETTSPKSRHYSKYDEESTKQLVEKLRKEYPPKSALEVILFDRLAHHYVKLCRLKRAEGEYIESLFDRYRAKIEPAFPDIADDFTTDKVTVLNPGYQPLIGADNIRTMTETYSAPESETEKKFYTALQKYLEIRALKNGGAS